MNIVEITNEISVGDLCKQAVLIAGPCAMEDEETVLETAEFLCKLGEELKLQIVFKSSFDKANRSSLEAARGMGLEAGLRVLERVRREFGFPVTTDVHETWQCAPVGEVVDIVQIPAFLARQTDLLVAAARTGKVVNVKKGQFMAPDDMKNVVAKILKSGNERILLCERGTMFGYHRLIVDMAGLVEMRALGFPVVFDATHSVQLPGACGTHSGGCREMVPSLLNAACAVGIDAMFLEVHPDPDRAISDAANQIPLGALREILLRALEFDALARKR